MLAEVASVHAAKCGHLSSKYSGWCMSDDSCTSACREESMNNIGGLCDDFPLRCYCITSCSP
ncbi:hypothetical protein BAE44_0012911 [Dichanthelium oligosanthes]|uniref:Knottins-like domain-containing protein n=1 Tax=Dichanthelium oligosanthes TaxID=888268 RepID=A0A1E5VLR6_9POAL|nr:hypothetical protein BAE44_0012911 [Dichanthelium oligosanthes]